MDLFFTKKKDFFPKLNLPNQNNGKFIERNTLKFIIIIRYEKLYEKYLFHKNNLLPKKKNFARKKRDVAPAATKFYSQLNY